VIIRKDPSISLKLRYPIFVRVSILVSILLMIVLLRAFPRFGVKKFIEKAVHIDIEQIEIPQTQQFELPPPPARPSIPIESEDEDLADDVTIEETELDIFKEWDAPPPPDQGPQSKFIPYDDPPVPIGGYTAIQRNIVYPEIAQEAGIEGTVVIQAFVNKKGNVTDTVVLKGIPNTGLDEAAMAAIKKTKFNPAKQRDRAVGVWISIPVNFRLKG
jgi:protein TonB